MRFAVKLVVCDTEQEYLDWVDHQDLVVTSFPRGSAAVPHGLNQRIVHILVFRPSGELLLQQRGRSKGDTAFHWTTSAAGCVSAGELYLASAVRELREETGIVVNEHALTEILSLTPAEIGHPQFVKVYYLVTDQEASLTVPNDEIENLIWMPPSVLNEEITLRTRVFAAAFLGVWDLFQSKFDFEKLKML